MADKETSSAPQAPRPPNQGELAQIEAWVKDQYGGEIDPDWKASAWIAVFDDYITDCPGYAGKVIVAVWGGSPGTCTTFTVSRDGRLEHAASMD